MSSDGIGSPSDLLGDRIRDLRRREGLSRDDLAEAARACGAPETFTGAVVGYLESGRRKDGRRTREFSLDEAVAIAAALEVSVVELLGDQAVVLLGVTAGPVGPAECPRCAGERSQVEATVRRDMAALANLDGIEPSLAETAYVLGRAIDAGGGDEGRMLPALSKQLVATLEAIAAGRRGEEDPGEDEFDDLDDPE